MLFSLPSRYVAVGCSRTSIRVERGLNEGRGELRFCQRDPRVVHMYPTVCTYEGLLNVGAGRSAVLILIRHGNFGLSQTYTSKYMYLSCFDDNERPSDDFLYRLSVCPAAMCSRFSTKAWYCILRSIRLLFCQNMIMLPLLLSNHGRFFCQRLPLRESIYKRSHSPQPCLSNGVCTTAWHGVFLCLDR